jgi:hypothetical protein
MASALEFLISLNRLSKPYTGATAVLVDEFDVRFLKSPSYDPEGTRGAAPSSQ